MALTCSLPRVNPQPIEHDMNLTITTATGDEFNVTVPLSIRYANLKVTKAEVSKDGKNLNIVIKNSGNKNLKNAKVKLEKPFETDIQDLSFVEANSRLLA